MKTIRLLATVFGVSTALFGEGRIAPELLTRRESEAVLQVMVVLRQQPQRAIAARVESAARLQLDVAEEKWVATSRRAVVTAPEMEVARQQLDELIVKVRQATMKEIAAQIRPVQESVQARLEALGGTGIRRFVGVNALVADVPGRVLEELAAHPDVLEVGAVPEVRGSLDVSVPAMGTAAFWNRGVTGSAEPIAVMDSGIRPSHPMFAGKRLVTGVFGESYKKTQCFEDTADSVEDRNGHGTHVAGIVGGAGTGQFAALQGVARGVGTLVILKALFQSKLIPGQCGGSASGSGADIFAAFDWAVTNTPARIFNFSLGGEAKTDDAGMTPIFDYLADALKLTVAVAAGNEGPGAVTVGAPGIGQNVISVANFDDRNTVERNDDVIAPSSSRGPTVGGRFKPDLAAPGSAIRSAAHNSDGFVNLTGTSMASPHVAGAAALLYQAGVNDPLRVKALLINSSDGAGWRSDFGWGSINLTRAQAALGSVVRGAIGAGTVKFYRGRIGSDFKATLTWNRHVDFSGQAILSVLHNLNLELFNRLDGSSLDKSESTLNNVEQVRTSARGDALIKVSVRDAALRGGLSEEPYALAVSESGFTEVGAPALEATCQAPANAAPGAAFTVSCSVRNSGGLDAPATSAVIVLPSAFRAVGPVNVGTVAAGATVPVVFNVAAPTAGGSYDLTVNVTSNAFGEAFRAAGSATVRVAAPSLPVLTLTAESVEFTFRTGDAAPAARTVDVRVNGSGVNYTAAAASSGNWLSVTPASGALPATLRLAVAPQSLAPGVHNGAITVTAQGTANTPLTIPVSLRVEAPSTARLAERLLTKAVPDSCGRPTAATTFLPTDPRAFVWFLMNGAARGDRASVTWTAPDGVVYQTGGWQPLESAGNFCFSSALSLAGTAAASKPGTWRVSVTWNGADLFNLTFTVGTPVSVRQSVLAKVVDAENVCAEPEATEKFFTTDREAYLWFILDRTRGGENIRYEFLTPGKSVALSGRWAAVESAGSWCFRTRPLAIAGSVNGLQPGTWTVNVYLNDDLMFTFPFDIVKGFTIENSMLTRNVGESGCQEPDPHGGFYRGEQRAIFWFLVTNPAAGDVPTTEWITPSGEVYTTISWDAVTDSGGSRCYWAWIDIADNSPSTQLGEWKVRLKWNDQEMSVTPFHILSVEIGNRMTTRQIPEGAGCPTPTPSALYATTDPSVTLWFLISRAAVGDAPRVEWFGPTGRVAFRTQWPALTRAGNFCFTSTLRIAGNSPPLETGEWVARVFWNDAFLFNQHFQIRAPQAGSGSGGSSDMVVMSAASGFEPESRVEAADGVSPEIPVGTPRRRQTGSGSGVRRLP